MITVVMGMKMWTKLAEVVDKLMLCTTSRTTTLQDVNRMVVSCVKKNQILIAQQSQFPQSPALITIIRSIYTHPHVAITTSRQRNPGASI